MRDPISATLDAEPKPPPERTPNPNPAALAEAVADAVAKALKEGRNSPKDLILAAYLGTRANLGLPWEGDAQVVEKDEWRDPEGEAPNVRLGSGKLAVSPNLPAFRYDHSVRVGMLWALAENAAQQERARHPRRLRKGMAEKIANRAINTARQQGDPAMRCYRTIARDRDRSLALDRAHQRAV